MNRTKAYFGFGLRLVFGLAIVATMLALVDTGAVLSALRSLAPAWLVLAFVINVMGSIVAPAIATSQSLAAGNLRIPLAHLVRINLAMRFYVLTLPHAITVGMRWMRYKNTGQRMGWEAAALILFERTIQFNVIAVFAFIFLMVSYVDLPNQFRILALISGLLILPGLFVLLLFVSRSLFSSLGPAIKGIMGRIPGSISRRLDSLLGAISTFHRLEQTRVVSIVGWTVAGYLLFVLSAYILILGLGLPLGFSEIGWMRSVVFLLTTLPITVGGLGIREAGFAALLYGYGIDGPTAVAFPLLLLGIQLAIGAVGALTELVRALQEQRRGK